MEIVKDQKENVVLMTMAQMIDLRDLFIQFKSVKMPIRTTYQITKFLQKTESDMTFYRELYQEIIEEYASRDEKNEIILGENGTIKIEDDRAQECIEKINVLRNQTIDNINLKLFNNDLEKMELSVEQLYLLLPYMVD